MVKPRIPPKKNKNFKCTIFRLNKLKKFVILCKEKTTKKQFLTTNFYYRQISHRNYSSEFLHFHDDKNENKK
jgi:hypothetical protein